MVFRLQMGTKGTLELVNCDLRHECVPQATMCMVMVGIGSELPDEVGDQIELSRALVDFSDTIIDTSTFNHIHIDHLRVRLMM